MALLEMRNINKSFFGVPVLQNIDLTVEAGEIHALLGENGAGKSTLMNILGGVYTKDDGSIVFDGQVIDHMTIRKAEELGIAFVHQELNIINELRVYENLFLKRELTGFGGRLLKKEMIEETRQFFAGLGVEIEPTLYAAELDISKKQLLEIAIALHKNAKLIILDEPTSALNNEEIDSFFNLVRTAAHEGAAFIFISHKMPEIFALADRYTVLRDGELIISGAISDVTPQDLTKAMIGKSTQNTTFKGMEKDVEAEVVLEIKNLSGEGFKDINLSLRKGEVISITGLRGAGCSELLSAIFGLKEPTAGEIWVKGERLPTGDIKEAMRRGIGMVPADRKENAVIDNMCVLENSYVSEHCLTPRRQNIRTKRELARYRPLENKLNIKTNSEKAPIVSFSGGNQQKVILARWLNTEADILLLDNPTQGIDVGAKEEIYALVNDLAAEGKSILIHTLEIPEIKKMADSCVVFYHGGIAESLCHEDICEERVVELATQADFDNNKTETNEAGKENE
ncbi:MAG: sugar ABC transporter ATP-binding protein [Eubacteriales bacterium]|nr:sugar ABC transporter ATP-binding protein [Eubacteriales bacterium]MDD4323230.1 sugar ABC transporter ATP-binding protein [Eubacteriales bacterium]MDD4541396.1 sugar ABC transporter ATP-binding protein [Eubacteriales bacterium]